MGTLNSEKRNISPASGSLDTASEFMASSDAAMASAIAHAVEASFRQSAKADIGAASQSFAPAESSAPRGTPPVSSVKPSSESAPHQAAAPEYTNPAVNSDPPMQGSSLMHAIRARQRKDLPDAGVSLKAAEKQQALISRISGALSPIRFILLLLMGLALGGRQFNWMLLGFLGGDTGLIIILVLTLLAMAVSFQSLARAFKDFFFLRFSFDSLLLVTTAAAFADALLSGDTETLLPLAAIGWCLTGTAALLTTRGKLQSLRTVIDGKSRTGVRVSANKWDGMDCIGKTSASAAGFVRRLEERDTWLRGWTPYGLLLLAACLILSGWLSIRTSNSYLHIFSVLLTISLPVSGAVCCARPFQLLSRSLRSRAAVSGWSGMRMLAGRKAALIYDRDLFPQGTITHKGVKVYGSQTPQLLVSYGASLIRRGGSVLNEPFSNLLQETGGEIYDVDYFQMTEGGLTGRINGVFVAVGTYNFMQLMGILPPESGIKGGLFIAVGGEIAGLFAMKYHVSKGAAAGFHRMVRDRRLSLLVATRNLCVNPSFLERWFQVSVADLICPKADTRRMLSQSSLLAGGSTCGYVLSDGVGLYSRLVVGARRCFRTGLVFTVLSMLLSAGLLLLTVRAFLTGAGFLGGPQLLLIQIILWILIEISARISAR